MTTALKKKLCWNCEGRVSLEQENCPYCAVYLGPAPDESNEKRLLTPPYRLVDSDVDEVPPSPYMEKAPQANPQEENDYSQVKSDLNEVVLPMALLSAGTLFFLFGVVLLLFSNHGILTLSWSGESWYLYLIFSLPLLGVGWWAIQRDIQDESRDLPDEKEAKMEQEQIEL